jgi:type II secretion system protein N
VSDTWKRFLLTIFGYTLYGILVFAFLVYLQFPYDLVRSRLLSLLKTRTDVQVSLGHIAPALPLDIAFKGLQVSTVVNTQSVTMLAIEELRTRPQVLPLVRGDMGMHFQAALYGGKMTGHAMIEGNGIGDRKLAVRARLEELDVQQYTPLLILYNVKCRGKLEGEVALNSLFNQWIEGKGETSFVVKNGEVEGIKIVNVTLPTLPYDEFKGDLLLDEGKLTLKLLELRGKEINAEVKGTITLVDPLPISTLNLTVRVRASGALGQQVTPLLTLLKVPRDRQGFLLFRVSGTVQEPRLSL